jgi:hypothetical protein
VEEMYMFPYRLLVLIELCIASSGQAGVRIEREMCLYLVLIEKLKIN